MALEGYPQTKDHPKQTILVEGEEITGNIAFLKAMGNEPDDWVEYELKFSNTASPATLQTIRVLAGSSLYGPFSYVKHNDEGPTGGTGVQDCYTQIIETEI